MAEMIILIILFDGEFPITFRNDSTKHEQNGLIMLYQCINLNKQEKSFQFHNIAVSSLISIVNKLPHYTQVFLRKYLTILAYSAI